VFLMRETAIECGLRDRYVCPCQEMPCSLDTTPQDILMRWQPGHISKPTGEPSSAQATRGSQTLKFDPPTQVGFDIVVDAI
jgi:hypothetical protein